MQLGQGAFAWLELTAFVQDDLGNRLRRENVQVDSRAVLERLSVLEQRYLHFNLLGPFEGSWRGQRHTAGKLFQLHSRQVEGRALAGACVLGRRPMNLHAAHPRTLVRGEYLNLLFLFYFASDEGSGHDRSKALHHEDTIDRQAEQRLGVASRNIRGQARDLALEFVQARALQGAHGDDRRAAGVQERPADKVLDLETDHVERLVVHQIGFGNDGDPARDGEQPADLKMLAGLRLDRFVGGDHQQHQVHAADPRQHVAHKALVAGNIDEAKAQLLAVGRVQFQMSKAEIDGDAPPLLLFQTVGVDPGQSFHQRGLPVIDVAGGADD